MVLPLLIGGGAVIAGVGATIAAELGAFGTSAKPSKVIGGATRGAQESMQMIQLMIPFFLLIMTMVLVIVAVK